MTLTTEKKRKIRETLADPVKFARKWLQADLWDTEAQILHSVAQHPRTAVKACHASGKTFVAALAALWWLARWMEAIVVTTAPTWTQVEKLLWGEIHKALGKSLYPFPKATMTELRIGPERYAMGLSTSVTNQDEGVRFQGFHAAHILMILDEAPGVDPKIWDAIEGARAGGDVRILALGNPTVASGKFHDVFHEQRDGWKTFTISAFNTPNLRGITVNELLHLPDEDLDRNVRNYLTTRRWVREKFSEWGPGHPLWESRVLGEFPHQAADALLSLTWLEQAKYRTIQGKGKLRAGLDVAGPGEDETVLCIRRGPQIVRLESWPDSDPRGEVVATLMPYRDELETVNVDSIGIGWGMYCHLLDHEFPASAVNVGESPSDPEKYVNLKAELYWGLRMRAQSGDLCGVLDDRTIAQLSGIRYKHNARGQVVIESKDEARKRGVKSPDRAEAIMLAFAEIVESPEPQRVIYDDRVTISAY